MQVARKLTLPLAVSAFVALGVSAWLSVRDSVELHHTDIERDQATMGRVLIAALERERAHGLTSAVEQLLTESNREHHMSTRIVPISSIADGTLSPEQRDALRRGENVFALDVWRSAATWLPLTLPDGTPGAVWIEEPLDEELAFFNSTVSRHALNAVALGVLWAIVALGLGALVIGRPMAALAEKARRVSRGDYLGPLQLTQRDEIGQLAGEMNRMCDELLRAEEQLSKETRARQHAQDALRHADRLTTVGLLGAGIAHEMGTPLNVVSMRARMIATGEVSGDEAKAGAHVIHEQAAQMTRIIRQLLDFARRAPPTMSRVDLRELSAQVVSMVAPLADEKTCKLEVVAGEAVVIDGDHHRLTQVLTNLVINAVQAMPAGGTVQLSATTTRTVPPPDVGGPEATFARLDVHDQGEGIPPEVLPRLFEPFFTTKPVGDGTGLGLSVAWGILRDHHGWIDVASSPGAGTTFSLFIPLERAPA